MTTTTLFHVTYYSKRGRIVLTETIREWDYWEACKRCHREMPSFAVDFDVEEVTGDQVERLSTVDVNRFIAVA